MPAQTIQQNFSGSFRLLLLLVLSLIISGCGTTTTNPKPPELGAGLVFPGADNSISLGGFWFNSEGAGVAPADRITQPRDPIGGYLFLYWVDDQGNVCHGQPGVSGQPGPVYIKAFQQQAYDLAVQTAAITTTQLVDLQKSPYRIDSYISKTKASGLHFVQYGGVLWRDRNTGSGYWDRSQIIFSVPLIISVDTSHTLFPYYPAQQDTCNSGAFPLPSSPYQKLDQDPGKCLTRTLPGAESMTYPDSLKYCLVKLPQGMNGTEWP